MLLSIRQIKKDLHLVEPEQSLSFKGSDLPFYLYEHGPAKVNSWFRFKAFKLKRGDSGKEIIFTRIK